MTIWDITLPIENAMVVWPGDPPVSVQRVLDVGQGDPATVSRLTLGSHTGTHVDAFSHFKADGVTLDAMDLSPYLGPARVVEIEHPQRITREELSALDWRGVDRVLFKTQNSATPWGREPFNPDFVHLSPEAAAFLVEQGVRLVGIDYLSVEGYHQEAAPTHHRLIDAGVYILEGLFLQEVPPGWYELLCLPLKIKDGDGAPARAVLRSLPTGAYPPQQA